MQAFLQPTLLFLTSLAHQSMTGEAQAIFAPGAGAYQNYNPYANAAYATMNQAAYYQPQRAYAPAYGVRTPFRRPLRMRQPAIQPSYYDYNRAARPLYATGASPYAPFYPGGQQQVAQFVLVNPAALMQSMAHNQQQRPMFVMLQPQAFAQAQQPESQVVSRAVPQSQLLAAHPQTQTIVGHPQHSDANAFTVGASYSYQNQELGKSVGHGKK